MPDRPSSASPHTVQPGRELTIAAVIRRIVTESSMMRIRRFIELQAPNPLYTSPRTAGIPAILYPGEIKDGRETTPSGMRGCSISMQDGGPPKVDNRQARKRLHIITFPSQETN